MFKLCAPCAFGLEGLLSVELKNIGMKEVLAENGRVLFSGDARDIVKANMYSRMAERILIVVGSFTAENFDQLFDSVKSLNWHDYIGKLDAFPVKGWALQSELHSIPDCQAIIKKAIVEKLSEKYKINWFEETGTKYQVQFSILKNAATIMIDTSGNGLHKRGYRAMAGAAPIKETLAAGMISLMRLYDDTNFYDPFCGSGTILIEALQVAHNIAPGINRHFACERYSIINYKLFNEIRQEAIASQKNEIAGKAFGSDIDKESIELTMANAKKAGVSKSLELKVCDIKDFDFATERALMISNPPYGERLLEIEDANKIYRILGSKCEKLHGRRYQVITPSESFEHLFGRPADKKRTLYNGMIKCTSYQYYK